MTRLAIDLIFLLIGFLAGYAIGLWAGNYSDRYKEALRFEMTINDMIKSIEERNSVSEYDSDGNTSPNQTKEK